MGCAQSMSEEAARSRAIGKELKRDFSRDATVIKLLLLGAGESGKSTVVKQMKLLHAVDNRGTVGFTAEERSDARQVIYGNVVDSAVAILDAVDLLDINIANNKINEFKCKVQNFASTRRVGTRPPDDVTVAIAELWKDPSVQLAYSRRNEYQLNDSASYFLSSVERICSEKDYVPTDQDMLRSRVTTTGIVKIEFSVKHLTFHMFDVGGQRSERKKWIHCFDNVTAVLFVVSLSEFDQKLFEDSSCNRMHESLALFGAIANNVHFKYKPFIVFFNKRDLFEEKLRAGKSIRIAFDDYSGDNSFESVKDFIVDKYLGVSETHMKQRPMYAHLTTATDTQLINRVFNSVTEIIMNDILKDIGLN